MQPISVEAVQAALQPYVDKVVYLHLETTNGAYTEGTFGVFYRNARVQFSRASIHGTARYRVGLQTEHGFIYAEGLTDWEIDAEGRLLLAGHDQEGRLQVALELSHTPFPA